MENKNKSNKQDNSSRPLGGVWSLYISFVNMLLFCNAVKDMKYNMFSFFHLLSSGPPVFTEAVFSHVL